MSDGLGLQDWPRGAQRLARRADTEAASARATGGSAAHSQLARPPPPPPPSSTPSSPAARLTIRKLKSPSETRWNKKKTSTATKDPTRMTVRQSRKVLAHVPLPGCGLARRTRARMHHSASGASSQAHAWPAAAGTRGTALRGSVNEALPRDLRVLHRPRLMRRHLQSSAAHLVAEHVIVHV